MIDQGHKDGKILVAGTPEAVAEHSTSCMGMTLKQGLERLRPEVLTAKGGHRGLGEGVRVAWVVAYKFVIVLSVQEKH